MHILEWFSYLPLLEILAVKLMYCAFPQVPAMKEKKDKPIVSYIGDSVVLECKLKHTPNTWNWYKANNTEKVNQK